MKNKINIGILIISFLFSGLLWKVNAQTTSLTLSPSLLEASIKPGSNITQSYKLTNNSDQKLEIVPQIIPFLPDGESGKIKLTPLSEKQPARPEFFTLDNLKFDEPFSLDIGQTKEIVLNIAIPRNTLESDYYYTLLFGTQPAFTESGNSKIDIASQIGANLLLSIYATEAQPSYGGIAEFSVPQIIDSFSPVNFVVRLENSGRSFWKPFGQITVSGLTNQKNIIKLPEQNILANSTRKLTIGGFKPRLPIGPFKAKIEFTLNPTGEKLYKEIEFWYVPYKAAAGLLLLLLIMKIGRRRK